MNNNKKPSASAQSLSPTWFEKNWRKSLLLIVTAGGVLAMVIYKVSVTKHNFSFVALVLFTETAAGVAVFAQALLRKISQENADKAFKYSIYARIAMAVIGVAIFIEAGQFGWVRHSISQGLIFPFISFEVGVVSVTAFFTYEVGNGLMLLVEWMFSHLLSVEDYDARAQVAKLTTALDEQEQELELARTEWDKSEALLEEIRAHLQTALGDDPLLNHPLPMQLAGLVEKHGREMGELDQATLVRELITKARGGAVESVRKVAKLKSNEVEQIGEVYQSILQLTHAQAMVKEMAGRAFTVRKNVQAFYCLECMERTEIGRSKPKVCSQCGTEQPTYK